MKKIKFFAIVASLSLVFMACNKPNEVEVLVPVTVHVDGFSISQEDFPAASQAPARVAATTEDVANYNGVNAITLAFYKVDDTEAYKSTQARGDANFGEFSLSLPMGSYTMVVLAYYNSDASPLELTSPSVAAFTGTRAYETFAYTQAVNITNTNAVDISATLDRVVTQLKVVSTDGKTADVTNVRMTFSAGGKDFNPTTGLAITNTGFANTVSNSASVGATSTSLSFLFLATDEQTMNVTIETLDADGNTLFSKTIENVPFKRNRITKLTGAMYTNTGIAGSFQVNTDWLSEQSVNF